ncbi:MAG: hypothetical protein IJO58_02460 [Clostridia bacterium]|nr:hypothetical protein [Clostridia bacterium]MBQ9846661.1 hypothetical protein [Clostridia bacterium]MBQ9957909.1 hypothetical protein [Clostridia bacterium]
MKKWLNGEMVEMTEQEIAEMNEPALLLTYEQRIVLRIREKYSVDDELAILRQRDTKPDEFAAYNDFVEGIKREEREG